jgi:hypothetical protein
MLVLFVVGVGYVDVGWLWEGTSYMG